MLQDREYSLHTSNMCRQADCDRRVDQLRYFCEKRSCCVGTHACAEAGLVVYLSTRQFKFFTRRKGAYHLLRAVIFLEKLEELDDVRVLKMFAG
jgi:hypothetical protein